MRNSLFALLMIVSVLLAALGLSSSKVFAFRDARIDQHGVMRWQDDGSEVALFGVNYLLPFTLEYHNVTLLDEDPWITMERDFSHFKRLGVDLIRIHIFDREISDARGHLVESVHLHLLDRLVELSHQHGIYLFLTPIAWWWTPNASPGFSTHYPMHDMSHNEAAIRAQETYLHELISRVNPRTGRRYADEPHIIAWEIINEPLYRPDLSDDQLLKYIERLKTSILKTGTTKPIFYNFWEGKAHLAQASGLDGATFNWYPTGLNAEKGRFENVLPLVERVPWPDYDTAYDGMAKAVYEFDAADILSPVYLPAMARTMRRSGVQMAAQFQYDALATAPTNVAYTTHYLNMAYTPDKAIALWIAGQVFRELQAEMPAPTPGDLADSAIPGLMIDAEQDIVVLNRDTLFAYTDSTDVEPASKDELQHVFGVGSSPVVRYPGTGTYFLDQERPGVWSMDVFPDLISLSDPHVPTKLGREVGRLIARAHPMVVDLPGLEQGFAVVRVGDDQEIHDFVAPGAAFEIEPGNYWLVSASNDQPLSALPRGDRPFIPQPEPLPLAVRHDVPNEAEAGRPLTLKVTVASQGPPRQVVAVIESTPDVVSPEQSLTEPLSQMSSGPASEPSSKSRSESPSLVPSESPSQAPSPVTLPLQPVGPYEYRLDVPGHLVQPGQFRYQLLVETDQGRFVFPGSTALPISQETTGPHGKDRDANPGYYDVNPGYNDPNLGYSEVNLAVAQRFGRAQTPGVKEPSRSYVPEGDAGFLRITADEFEYPDGHTNMSFPVVPAPGAGVLVTEMRSTYPQTHRMQIVLIDEQGRGFGRNIPLSSRWEEVRTPIEDLQAVWDGLPGNLQPEKLTQIAMIFGSWLYGFEGSKLPHGFEVRRIAFEPAPTHYEIPVVQGQPYATTVLYDPAFDQVSLEGVYSRKSSVVSVDGRLLLHMAADGFGASPHWVYFYHRVPDVGGLPAYEDSDSQGFLEIEIRSLRPHTDQVEIVFVERDGAPWGTNIEVSEEWSVVRLDPADLHYFSHWGKLPAGRGAAGDQLQIESLHGINVGFGAWLFPGHEGEAHGIELGRIVYKRRQP